MQWKWQWMVALACLSAVAFARQRGFRPQDCPLALLAHQPAKSPATRDTKLYLLRTHQTPEGPYYEALNVTTYDGPGDFLTYVVRREVHAGVPSISPEEQERLRRRGITEDKAEAIHFALIAPVLRENIGKYRERRDWPESFDKKMWKSGKEYLNDSVYVVVARKSNHQVVGGMRVIHAPYSLVDGKPLADGAAVRNLYGPVHSFRDGDHRVDPSGLPLPPSTLPELAYLGIDVNRPAVVMDDGEPPVGMLNELGAFFVDEKLSPLRKEKTPNTLLTDAEKQQVWAEWLTALESIAHEWGDDHFAYYGQAFHFYADPVSRRIYKPFQYTPLRQYENQGKPVAVPPDQEVPLITRDGVKWVPVVWYLEAIDDYYRRFSNGQVPQREQVSPFEVLSRRVASGDFFNPASGMVLSGEPELTTKTLVWAATEPKLPTQVSAAATGMLIRTIDLFNMHAAVRLKEGEGTDVGQRAKRTSRGMQNNVEQALNALRQMRSNPNWIFRHNLARYYNQLLESAPGRVVLNEKELLKDFIAPALLDEHPWVRQQTLWSFRDLTPERILEDVGRDKDRETVREQALSELKASGISAAELAPAVSALAAALRSPKPADDSRPVLLRYWDKIRPALVPLEKVRGHGPAISLPLLTLAALEDPPAAR